MKYGKRFLREQYALNIRNAIARGGLLGAADDAPSQTELPLKSEPKTDDKKSDDSAALKADLKAKEERLAKLEADEKKRTDEANKAKDAKAIEEGKAKELLAQKEKELTADRERLAAFEEREKKMAKALYDRLSDSEKESAKVLEGKLSVADYVDYLQVRIGAGGDGGIAPPGGTPGKVTGGKKLRELHPETREVLDDTYANETVARVGAHLEKQVGDKFTLDKKRFVNAIRARSKLIGKEPGLPMDAVDKIFGAGTA